MNVAVPRAFVRDRKERGLPTPAILDDTTRHFLIDFNDPAVDELIADAKRYAGGGTDCAPWLRLATIALLKALGVALVP